MFNNNINNNKIQLWENKLQDAGILPKTVINLYILLIFFKIQTQFNQFQEIPRNNGHYMYSPNNNTDENIQEYYKNKQKNNYLNNSFQNADSSMSLMPYNSMPLSQYQIGAYQLSNNFNPQ